MFLLKSFQHQFKFQPIHLPTKYLAVFTSNLTTIDYSLLPKLREEDLEEKAVRGSGPGGQATNKTSNCIVLKHKPTGLIVKCHAHRMMHQNQKEARRLLLKKLDNLLNGERSIENQEKQIEQKKFNESTRRRKKLAEMKRNWKEREMMDDQSTKSQ